MRSLSDAIGKTVPISQFNRGMAGKIFSDAKVNGPKVVIKNNEVEGFIVSPDAYREFENLANDYELLSLALERLEHFDAGELVPQEKVWDRLGITDEDVDNAPEIEFE